MKYINLVYEDDYEDADILLVPDEIADNIDNVMREYFRWIKIPENNVRFLVKVGEGKEVLSIDTEGFLWWLNNVKLREGTKAIIEKQHTMIWQGCPVAEF